MSAAATTTRRRKPVATYKSYVVKLAKPSPVSENAKTTLHNLIVDFSSRIAQEASAITHHSKRKTIDELAVHSAVKTVFGFSGKDAPEPFKLALGKVQEAATKADAESFKGVNYASGLVFPVSRFEAALRLPHADRVTPAASVALAAFVQSVVQSIVDGAIAQATEKKTKTLTPQHVHLAISEFGDSMHSVVENVIIARGGVVSSLPAAGKRKRADEDAEDEPKEKAGAKKAKPAAAAVAKSKGQSKPKSAAAAKPKKKAAVSKKAKAVVAAEPAAAPGATVAPVFNVSGPENDALQAKFAKPMPNRPKQSLPSRPKQSVAKKLTDQVKFASPVGQQMDSEDASVDIELDDPANVESWSIKN